MNATVPIIGSAVFAAGILWRLHHLVDAYPLYATNALAANSLARSSFAAAFPLFGVQMYNKLDFQWATTLQEFLTLVTAVHLQIWQADTRHLSICVWAIA
ncbi:hypothetical protein ABVK25_000099 [Lepraria finkii]|uniref:Uncharacterized protein n=1 Tax=Lepraria finkii TaxID=1340010 RepID=A0ABR4BR93_9LECA